MTTTITATKLKGLLLLALLAGGAAWRGQAYDTNGPCWRGGLVTSFQEWTFDSSNTITFPEVATSNNVWATLAPVTAVTNLGAGARGWKSGGTNDVFCEAGTGLPRGYVDVGMGSLTLNIANTNRTTSGMNRYLVVQCLYYYDGAITAPRVTVSGTGIGTVSTVYSNAVRQYVGRRGGDEGWYDMLMAFKVPAGQASGTPTTNALNQVTITNGGGLLLLLDDVLVDTITLTNSAYPTPVAGADFGGTLAGTPVSFSAARLLANDSAGAYLLAKLVGTSQGGTAVSDGTQMTYTPPDGFADAQDTFTYTIVDCGYVKSAVGTVTVSVLGTAAASISSSSQSAAAPEGTVVATILAQGVPGYRYGLRSATNLTPPVTWTDLPGTATAGVDATNLGVVILQDTNKPAPPALFYRTKYLP